MRPISKLVIVFSVSLRVWVGGYNLGHDDDRAEGYVEHNFHRNYDSSEEHNYVQNYDSSEDHGFNSRENEVTSHENQVEDSGRDTIDIMSTRGDECDRKCGGPELTCYFRFNVEDYVVHSPACGNCRNGVQSDCFHPQCVLADGFIKPIQTVNRALPGTPIVVCRNDTIVVDVMNRLADTAVTIHWHGIRQTGTPHMDGVPMVTQCPISPANTFRYSFKADDDGTFFWHSHLGGQKLDGLQGALIVRDTKQNELHRNLYDQDLTEHVIFIQDWAHVVSNFFTPGPDDDRSQVPDSVLINGRGPLFTNGTSDYVPMANFTVESGKRYRFRLISATCMTCAFSLKIQSHKLTVISADGGLDIETVTVDAIGINSADRFDFVLNANQPPGDYYIVVEGLDFCSNITQTAVLHYAGGSNGLTGPTPLLGENDKILNDPNSFCNDSTPNQLCMSKLNGTVKPPFLSSSQVVDYRQVPFRWGVYLYDKEDLFAPGTYQHYEEPVKGRLARYTVNNISFAPPAYPLLTQFNDINKTSFCTDDCRSELVQKSCSCTNYYSLPLKSVVDIIVYTEETRPAGFHHPIHLHGHNFFVLEQGVFPTDNVTERMQILDQKKKKLEKDIVTLGSAPARDSVTVPAGGYALLRFYADNPGWWIVHCHFLYHVDSGMAVVFKVGSDLEIPKPSSNFPKCGDYFG